MKKRKVDVEFYANFLSYHSFITGYVYSYFDKYIRKNNEDIEFKDVWFHPNGIMVLYENTNSGQAYNEKIDLTDFLEYINFN